MSEAVCRRGYSSLAPSTQGEVIYRALPWSIGFNSPYFNPYHKEVQDVLRTTNLRVTFTRLHTLSHYFSVYDMVVRGSCFCNGHAER